MKRFVSTAIASAALALSALPASATPISGVGFSGSITAGNGTVTITISDTVAQASVSSVIQNISGIYFTMSGYAGGAVSLQSMLSTNSTFIAPNASNVPTGTLAGAVSSGWATGHNGNSLVVCVICAGGYGTGATAVPAETIIGGSGSGAYPSAGGSINGNGPHNPFLVGPVTFTLNVAGVTAASTFDQLFVQFGTTAVASTSTSSTSGSGTTSGSLPEPSSSALALLGIALLAGTFLKRKMSLRA